LQNILRYQTKLINIYEAEVLNIRTACLYSCLSYPARNAHAPYCIVICGLYGCTTFSHIMSQMHDFRKQNYWTQMYVL